VSVNAVEERLAAHWQSCFRLPFSGCIVAIALAGAMQWRVNAVDDPKGRRLIA